MRFVPVAGILTGAAFLSGCAATPNAQAYTRSPEQTKIASILESMDDLDVKSCIVAATRIGVFAGEGWFDKKLEDYYRGASRTMSDYRVVNAVIARGEAGSEALFDEGTFAGTAFEGVDTIEANVVMVQELERCRPYVEQIVGPPPADAIIPDESNVQEIINNSEGARKAKEQPKRRVNAPSFKINPSEKAE